MAYERDEKTTEIIEKTTGAGGVGAKQEEEVPADNAMVKRRWFGRGIYESSDVPIKLLDRFIVGAIILAVVLTVIFAVNGGYIVSFDTQGGTEVPSQKLRYGKLVTEPEAPVKAGYVFDSWYYENEPDSTWEFALDNVGGDITLVARWKPAEITVKFDAAGGEMPDGMESKLVIYQETYGELPVPVRDGYTFKGWIYSNSEITSDTTVMMPGEHVLTAVWK